MAKILDGKSLSEEIYEKLGHKVFKIKEKIKRIPKLCIILIGDNIASHTYVKLKAKACTKIGIDSQILKYASDINEENLIKEIIKLNLDKTVDGMIVQLPLPKHINIDNIISNILPSKDVDGLNPLNFGKMALGLPCHTPATPTGILEILKKYNIETSGKNCVVVGRSRIVGLPISIMMSLSKYPGNATVTLCHSKTKNISEYTRNADILISAVGINNFITGDMVKENSIVIDVGINKVEDKSKEKGYRLIGDIDYNEVFKKASYITPVPGGVGPMTIAALLTNTLNAADSKNM